MEVILSDFKNHPSCPHGPCLMFERYTSSGNRTGRKFFACSACRDRKDCGFFQWVGDEPSAESKKYWEQMIENIKLPLKLEDYLTRLKTFKALPSEQRKFCKTCSLLVTKENENHVGHSILEKVTDQDLMHPSNLFDTVQNKKSEAQYFFSNKTVEFVVSLLKELGFSKLVLIGVPKVHEYLVEKCTETFRLSSYLMDIDQRYMQFFGPKQFCHYNLFNNHFFNGKKSKKKLKEFLVEDGGKVALLLDPPFGGLIEPICQTIKCIAKWWQKANFKTSDENIPVLWFFPYFNEGRILKNMPDVVMTDYKVEYVNHSKLKAKKKSNNSPVRIFTNISPSSFVLPSAEGYWFCKKCVRYVSPENRHCKQCNACTTKHGKTYSHCDRCQQCVKHSYQHCDNCNKCGPVCTDTPSTSCQNCKFNQARQGVSMEKCYECGGIGHRKRACAADIRNRKKRRVKL